MRAVRNRRLRRGDERTGAGGTMRILVLSNLYPPYYVGGYELGCRDIVDGLRKRGHTVEVLTTVPGPSGVHDDGLVHRRLSVRTGLSYGSLFRLLRMELRDRHHLRKVLRNLRPHVAVIFNMANSARSILLMLQRTGIPVVYVFSDQWLQPEHGRDPWLNLWTRKAAYWPNRIIKSALRRCADWAIPVGIEAVEIRQPCFTSHRLKELYLRMGFPVESAKVIHWGVDTERFRPRGEQVARGALRLLFAGRIHPEKGLHTAVEAVAWLKEKGELGDVTLSIVGPIQDGDYVRRIQETVERFAIEKNVRFAGKVPRDSMPDVYRDHDIFVFPSVWEEPFSIALLEAMASGLTVIGTTTGGSSEILEDEINALTFPAGHSLEMAERMRRMFADACLREMLSTNARQTILARFDLRQMVDRVEEYLQTAVSTGRKFQTRQW